MQCWSGLFISPSSDFANVTGYAHPDSFAVHPPSNARFQSGVGAVLFLPPHDSVSDCKDMAQELDLIGSYLDPLTVTSSVHERVLFLPVYCIKTWVPAFHPIFCIDVYVHVEAVTVVSSRLLD